MHICSLFLLTVVLNIASYINPSEHLLKTEIVYHNYYNSKDPVLFIAHLNFTGTCESCTNLSSDEQVSANPYVTEMDKVKQKRNVTLATTISTMIVYLKLRKIKIIIILNTCTYVNVLFTIRST